MSAAATTLHASCVALGGRAVLILGASGSGKSALALELMARGAALIADDRTRLIARDAVLIASAPPTIRGMIEARGVGLLAAEPAPPTPVALVVDLDQAETARLPQVHETMLLDVRLTLLRKVEHAHFPAAILQYLKGGRCA